MNALLIIAHGSRRNASNEEVRTLVKQVREHAGGRFSRVEPAFLELAEPDIPGAIARCYGAGVRDIVCVPYLLSAGAHVAQDIPAALDEACARHPGLQIGLRPHIGSLPGMVDLLLSATGLD